MRWDIENRSFEETMEMLDAKMARQPFRPFAMYNKIGDQLEIGFQDEAGCGEYVGHGITLMKSQEDDRIIGVTIAGFKNLILGDTVSVKDEEEGVDWSDVPCPHCEKPVIVGDEYWLDAVCPQCDQRIDWGAEKGLWVKG